MSIRKRTWRAGERTRIAWVVDYRDQHGKRRLKTFSKKKDADAWWDGQAAYEVRQGTHTPDSASVTLAEAAEKWLERGEVEGLERSTLEQYRRHVDHYIRPHFGTLKLSRLTAPAVQDFRDKLLADHSRAMAQKVLGSLKAIIKDAQKRGLVSQNVAAGVTVRRPSRHREHVVIPNKDEVRAILNAAEGRWRPLIVTLIFTGLRSSELRGLRWADVDFEAGVIRVSQRADRWNRLGPPKSAAGRREIPMTRMVANTLKEWRLACPKGELGLVFPSGAGQVEHHGNIWHRGLGAAQVAAGVALDTGRTDAKGRAILKPKYGPHAFRHFYASWLIEQGFAPKKVQTLLGHSSIQMTFDIYGHLFPSLEDDAAKLAQGEATLLAHP